MANLLKLQQQLDAVIARKQSLLTERRNLDDKIRRARRRQNENLAKTIGYAIIKQGADPACREALKRILPNIESPTYRSLIEQMIDDSSQDSEG